MAAYLVWFAPFIAAMFCLSFAIISYFLAKWLRNRKVFINKKMQLGVRVFLLVLMLCLLGMWIAASIAGGCI